LSISSLDTRALRLLRTRAHAPSLERFVSAFSKLGEHGGVWLAGSLAGALIMPSRRDELLCAARTIAVSFAANQAIKLAVRRHRPDLEGLPRLTSTASNRSYPSAHATTSFAGACALSRVVPPAPLYTLAAALALSRPYLGVHYPSDTVAGAVLGVAVAELLA
jgi:membrane-associated phospholipid phosphatase